MEVLSLLASSESPLLELERYRVVEVAGFMCLSRRPGVWASPEARTAGSGVPPQSVEEVLTDAGRPWPRRSGVFRERSPRSCGRVSDFPGGLPSETASNRRPHVHRSPFQVVDK